MLKRVLWAGRKVAAVTTVGNRLLCVPSTLTTALISKSNCSNQVCPSYKFLSTKTSPLLQEGSGSAKLGLEEAMGLFNSLILKEPRPPISEFDKLLGVILSLHQCSFKSRSIVVIALSKVMTSFEIQPSIATLSMLLDCYCSGVGRLDLGFSVLATIYKLFPDPDGAIYTSLPSGLIAQGCCKKLPQEEAGRNSIVAALTDNIKDSGGNSVSVKHVIDPRWARFADQLLSDVVELCPYTCLLRSLLISSLSKEETNPENFPDSPSTCTALNDALCQQGTMTEAHALLQHMISNKKLGLSQVLLEGMVKNGHMPAPCSYQHEQGKLDEANIISSLSKLATDARSPSIGIEGVVADTDVYSFILDGMCKAEKLSEAMQLFKFLIATGVEPNSRMYNLMVAALCNKEEDMWYQTTRLLCDMSKKYFELDCSVLSTLLEDCYTRLIKSKKLAAFLLEKIQGDFVPRKQFLEEDVSLIRKYLGCKDSIDTYVWILDRNYRLPKSFLPSKMKT